MDEEAAHWRELIILGRYCTVPPWTMEHMPSLWRDRLRISMDLDERLAAYQKRMDELHAKG